MTTKKLKKRPHPPEKNDGAGTNRRNSNGSYNLARNMFKSSKSNNSNKKTLQPLQNWNMNSIRSSPNDTMDCQKPIIALTSFSKPRPPKKMVKKDPSKSCPCMDLPTSPNLQNLRRSRCSRRNKLFRARI